MQRYWITVLWLVLVAAIGVHAQDDKQRVRKALEASAGSKSFNPRDFSGIWMQTKLDHSLGAPPPPLTPAGVSAKAGRIPDGPTGNAPWYTCNPMGFPRLENDDEPVEFIMLPNRILQMFQWEHRIRVLWTDGRKLPSGESLENLGPAWYGHSVGTWRGNMFVVNTVGLDDRAWLDNNGNPKSFHARIEQTYQRVDANTIEMQMTLYDPEYYTAPYVGSRKIYKRVPDDKITYFGWSGLFAGVTEGICAPMNEVEGYNKGFRDPGRAARP